MVMADDENSDFVVQGLDFDIEKGRLRTKTMCGRYAGFVPMGQRVSRGGWERLALFWPVALNASHEDRAETRAANP